MLVEVGTGRPPRPARASYGAYDQVRGYHGSRWNVDHSDWELLRAEAVRVAQHAYAPYSGLRVGAAALVDDGRVVAGCNVENASYGLGLCAECGLVSALRASGGGRLVAFVCVDGTGAPLAPCGRCRQLLYEHGGGELELATADGIRTLAQLLPGAFGPEDLPAVPGRGA